MNNKQGPMYYKQWTISNEQGSMINDQLTMMMNNE